MARPSKNYAFARVHGVSVEIARRVLVFSKAHYRNPRVNPPPLALPHMCACLKMVYKAKCIASAGILQMYLQTQTYSPNSRPLWFGPVVYDSMCPFPGCVYGSPGHPALQPLFDVRRSRYCGAEALGPCTPRAYLPYWECANRNDPGNMDPYNVLYTCAGPSITRDTTVQASAAPGAVVEPDMHALTHSVAGEARSSSQEPDYFDLEADLIFENQPQAYGFYQYLLTKEIPKKDAIFLASTYIDSKEKLSSMTDKDIGKIRGITNSTINKLKESRDTLIEQGTVSGDAGSHMSTLVRTNSDKTTPRVHSNGKKNQPEVVIGITFGIPGDDRTRMLEDVKSQMPHGDFHEVKKESLKVILFRDPSSNKEIRSIVELIAVEGSGNTFKVRPLLPEGVTVPNLDKMTVKRIFVTQDNSADWTQTSDGEKPIVGTELKNGSLSRFIKLDSGHLTDQHIKKINIHGVPSGTFVRTQQRVAGDIADVYWKPLKYDSWEYKVYCGEEEMTHIYSCSEIQLDCLLEVLGKILTDVDNTNPKNKQFIALNWNMILRDFYRTVITISKLQKGNRNLKIKIEVYFPEDKEAVSNIFSSKMEELCKQRFREYTGHVPRVHRVSLRELQHMDYTVELFNRIYNSTIYFKHDGPKDYNVNKPLRTYIAEMCLELQNSKHINITFFQYQMSTDAQGIARAIYRLFPERPFLETIDVFGMEVPGEMPKNVREYVSHLLYPLFSNLSNYNPTNDYESLSRIWLQEPDKTKYWMRYVEVFLRKYFNALDAVKGQGLRRKTLMARER